MAQATQTLAGTVVAPAKDLPKNYAGFNTCTVEGRIFNAEIVEYNDSRFLSVSVIQNLQDDDQGCEFHFNSSNGLLALFEKGYLPNGRRVHITGHMKAVEQVYTDKATGEMKLLKRPRVKLDQVNYTLGAMPSKKDA
jgi:hypothetical protein